MNSSLQAFSSAAGIPATELKELICTVLLIVFLVWAAWCVLGLVHHLRHAATIDEFDIVSKLIRILFLVSLMIAVVFAY